MNIAAGQPVVIIKGNGRNENEGLAPRRLLTALTAGAAGITTLTTRLFATATTTTRRLTATTIWGFAWFVPSQLFI